MSYQEYYELHKEDTYEETDFVFLGSNNELDIAVQESIKALNKDQIIKTLNQIREQVNHINEVRIIAQKKQIGYVLEFLNMINYLVLSINDNKLDSDVYTIIIKLMNNGYWFFYKEPFEDCLERLKNEYKIS